MLEMPVKLGYAPERYFAVTSTLYALFGTVGAAVQVAALVVAVVLAFLSRQGPRRGFAVAAASLLGLSLIAWGVLVAPVNARWGEAMASGSQALPHIYAQLRLRWECGHAVAFLLWLAGFCSLQWSALTAPATSRSTPP